MGKSSKEMLSSNRDSLLGGLFTKLLGTMWKARNARIFQGRKPDPTAIVETTLAQNKKIVRWSLSLGKQSKTIINLSEQWKLSASRTLNFNVDGSWVEGALIGSVVGVCRNSTGALVAGFANSVYMLWKGGRGDEEQKRGRRRRGTGQNWAASDASILFSFKPNFSLEAVMVIGSGNNNHNHQEDVERNPAVAGAAVGAAGAAVPRSGGGGGSRSWGTTASGQSVSTSGSMGSPSSRSEQAMATPASESTFLRMNHLDIHGDDAGSQGDVGGKKKKRGQRATAGDKSGRGLRQFSMKVCEKVESKGRTTYNEVADELVAEFADPGNSAATPDQQQYDEKNIRRRVLNDIEELKTERHGLRNRIEKKAAYLQELEEQYVGLQNLIQRNEQLFSTGNAPNGGIALPFILVQTRPHATVEVEISEDMQLVHFDFNSTPFELHDDNYVLKAMKFCERPGNDEMVPVFPSDGGEGSSMSGMYQPQPPYPPMSSAVGRPPASPPIPGILKARVKHEH
ncbi:hypothetical protein NL676_018186 [Syzygium grande]|nr:hypothetical protein NL676_018186 [Syzygium grande]